MNWPPRPGYYAEAAERLLDWDPDGDGLTNRAECYAAQAQVYATLEHAAAVERARRDQNAYEAGV